MAPTGPTTDARPAPSFRLSLFGILDAQVGGRPLPRLRTRKGDWLLALLALRHNREVPREFLMAMLWPDSDPGAAAGSLRQSLLDLRKALGEEARRIESTTVRTITFRADLDDVDVIAFDAAIKRGHICDTEQAVALYRGPLLEGCAEEWVVGEREQREQAWLGALETLASHELETGAPGRAVELLRRAVAADPFRETAHRGLMVALARAGDHGSVVECYRALRLRLSDELRCAPDPATTSVYEQLRADARARAVTAPAARPAPVLPRGAEPRLPCALTELIGREREADEVARLLEEARLVTLTGPGGVGKTRLATHVAERLAPDLADGAWFIDLSPVSDPSVVPAAVAGALGVAGEPGREPLDAVLHRLRHAAALVVFDNCEQVAAACARVALNILEASPNVRILATSRHVLGVVGEEAYAVPALSVPPADAASPGDRDAACPSRLMGFEAIRLFVRRARAARPGFALNPGNAADIASICRGLDGIPLAIELAAARVRAMSPAEIASHLADRFAILTSGALAGPERHRALAATMDWSYRLLSQQEQALLCRLSVFTSGWTHDAAEAVCADLGAPGEVMEAMLGLVDKSLVVHDADGPGRYRLLETVRQYAHSLLAASGEEGAARERHRDHFLARVETDRSDRDLPAPHWFEWLHSEYDELRAAMDFAFSSGSAETVLRFARALGVYWLGHSRREGVSRLRAALACPGPDAPDPLRARVLLYAAEAIWAQGEHEDARAYAAEAYETYTRMGDARGLAWALEALGDADYGAGLLDQAICEWTRSLEMMRKLGDLQGAATLLGNLGEAHRRKGDRDTARLLYEESREAALGAGAQLALALAAANLAAMACEVDAHEPARPLVREAIGGLWAIGAHWLIPLALPSAASTALGRGDLDRAARLLGAAEGLRESLGTVVQPADETLWARSLAILGETGRSDSHARAWAEGREMDMQAAVEYALSDP